MTSTIRSLPLLEEQGRNWREEYEEKERRMEEKYQRELAEINEEYERAAKRIKLEFAIRRMKVISEFAAEDAGKSSKSKLLPAADASLSPSDSTDHQFRAINHQQVCKQRPNSILPKRCVDAVYDSRKEQIVQSEKKNVINCFRLYLYPYEVRISTNQKEKAKVECKLAYNKCGESVAWDQSALRDVLNMSLLTVFVVYDPGGINRMYDSMQLCSSTTFSYFNYSFFLYRTFLFVRIVVRIYIN